MHCAEAWNQSVVAVSAGKPSATQHMIVRRRNPAGHPDRRRPANCSAEDEVAPGGSGIAAGGRRTRTEVLICDLMQRDRRIPPDRNPAGFLRTLGRSRWTPPLPEQSHSQMIGTLMSVRFPTKKVREFDASVRGSGGRE
jgi:hypothetical protein